MKKLAFYLINIVFILSFAKGALELAGISSTQSQLMIEGIIILVFAISINFVLRKNIIFGPGIIVTISFLIFIFISYLLNDTSLIQMMLYLRVLMVYYLLFYAMLNIPFTHEENNTFVKVLVVLFLIQIPAAIIKLAILGGTLEDFVGTMSVGEGSLATVMPLLASTFLIAKYLVFKDKKFIALILLFIGIGLMSNKMGVLFYVIFFFIFTTYLYSNKQKGKFIFNFTFIKKMFLTTIYIFIIFALFVSLNPRANPEHKIGGSIDIEYLINYTEKYQTLKLKGSRVEGDGRSDAPFVAFDKLSNGGILNILIGYGPGDIVKSSFTQYDNPLLQKYNIGYGGRLGLVWMMIQVGILGVIIFLLFHIILLHRSYLFYKRVDQSNNDELFIALSVLSISIVYFIDFFTYSSQMLHSPGVAITYFFALYYLISYEKEKKNESNININL